MLSIELLRSLHRVRTWLLAALAIAAAILPAVILKVVGPGRSQGPGLFSLITHAGLLDPVVALGLLQVLFLPLATGLLAGDSIAGDASVGMLRALLVRPVARPTVVLSKYAAVLIQLALGLLLLVVAGLVVGGLAFGFGPLPTLSGSVVSFGSGLLRVLGATAYIFAGLVALAAVGMFISTLTDSGPGATVATVAVALISEILDNVPGLESIQPYLLTHHWTSWIDLLRDPIAWSSVRQGLVLDGVWTAVFLTAAVVTFGVRDHNA